jgi:hypothetical protein
MEGASVPLHGSARHAGAAGLEQNALSMEAPDPRRRARREIVAALIGAEAGAGIGLLAFGGRELAPLALVAAGAVVGPAIALWLRAVRVLLFRRAVRRQLREEPARVDSMT